MTPGDRRPAVAVVLWDGELGGTELLYAGLASAMRRMDVDAEVVFVAHPGPLASRLEESAVPFHALGFARGRDVLRRPRAFAGVVSAHGSDGAILPERGFLGAALRLGGYRGRIVAGEHGVLLQPEPSRIRRALGLVNTLLGAWADDVEVGVSDFMVGRMRSAPHARQLQRIYNGLDTRRFAPGEEAVPSAEQELLVAFAARLIPGKGADDAIRAVADARRQAAMRLLIAGEGPERERLVALAAELGVQEAVSFLGLVADMPCFWQSCAVALFPSHQFIESFGMACLEAMACGKPVVATRNGAAPELVADQISGTVVEPGDVAAISAALVAYARDPELRRAHGRSARARVLERFDIEVCAREYLSSLQIAAGATEPSGNP